MNEQTNQSEPIKTTPFRELKHKYVGEVGTPERDAFDQELADDISLSIKQRLAVISSQLSPGQVWWCADRRNGPRRYKYLLPETESPDNTYFILQDESTKEVQRWHISGFLEATLSEELAYLMAIRACEETAALLRQQLLEITETATDKPELA